MVYDKRTDLIINHDLFLEEYIPPLVRERSSQIEDLIFCLSPALENRKPRNVWIFGKPGSGKTLVCRYVIKKLQKETNSLGVFVNCWKTPSFYTIIDHIIRELRILRAERQCVHYKIEKLTHFLKGKILLLFIDEIDQLSPKERNRILYNLCDMENVGIVAICNDKFLQYELDDRIRSRLNPQIIEFAPYTKTNLMSILSNRAELAIDQNAFNDEVLKRIADLAEDDARVAIQTLKNAVILAKEDKTKSIHEKHIQKGHNSVKHLKTTFLLNQMTKHHRIIYCIIKDNPKMLSGQLWERYIQSCKKKKIELIAQRTFSDYLRRLIDSGLIKAKRAQVKGQVRALSTA